MKASAAALCGAVLAFATALQAQLTPAGITGLGPFENSADLIIDGFTPPQNTNWQSAFTVSWTGFETAFTIDLGAAFRLQDIGWSVDNNDSYQLAYSLAGGSFTNLFAVGLDHGDVPEYPGGMDTMSGILGDPEYVASMDFAPVNARYLRISAVTGDALNAVGEVTAYGQRIDGAVPEPSTYGLCGAVALAGIAWLRRRRT